MRLNFLRKDSGVGVGVVIITGSCCIPGMAPFEEQARRIVGQAISETGVVTQVKEVAASTAMLGGVPREILGKLMADFQAGRVSLPLVLVNGKAVSYGVPKLDDVKSALLQAAEASITKEDHTNE